jgi:hypothetical protein
VDDIYQLKKPKFDVHGRRVPRKFHSMGKRSNGWRGSRRWHRKTKQVVEMEVELKIKEKRKTKRKGMKNERKTKIETGMGEGRRGGEEEIGKTYIPPPRARGRVFKREGSELSHQEKTEFLSLES